MASVSERVHNEETFTFVWEIENFKFWDKTNQLCSATFIADILDRTEWFLTIQHDQDCEDEDDIGISLRRGEDSGPCYISINYDILDPTTGLKWMDKEKFAKNSGYGVAYMWASSDFNGEQSVHLMQNGRMTVHCKMWKVGISSDQVFNSNPLTSRISTIAHVHCNGTTRVEVERFCYQRSLDDFLECGSSQKIYIPVSLYLNTCMNIFVKPISLQISNVEIEMRKQKGMKNQNYTMFFCKASILNKYRHRMTSAESSYSLTDKSNIWRLPLIEKDQIKKFERMEKDGLLLDFECVFSFGEISRINGYYVFPPIIPETTVVSTVLSTASASKNCKCKILERIFTDSKYCDIFLKVDGKNISAHRSILASNSPLFDAMFSNDMLEKQSSCIDVKGVDYDTMKRLLQCMYTGDLGELNVESASKLLSACDKYEYLFLMEKCADFLKCNLQVKDACDILILADAHQHEGLKEAAIDFICLNVSKIFPSQEWKEFLVERMDLASVVLTKVSENAIRT